MEARLVNRQTGETIFVNKPVFRMGRERSYVDYFVANPAISRHHCNLLERDNNWYLTDLNSTNGTYVNGVKLMPNQEVCLRSGDRLTLANVAFVFECDQPAQKVYQSFTEQDALVSYIESYPKQGAGLHSREVR